MINNAYVNISLCPEVVFCELTDGKARPNACQSRNSVIEATVHLAMLSSELSCVQVETLCVGTHAFCDKVEAILHAVFSVSSTWRVPVLKSRLIAQVSEPPRSGLSSETARTGSPVSAMMSSMPMASLPLVLLHRMLARWRSLSTQSPVTRPTAMTLQVEQLSPFPHRRNKPALTRQPCLWPLAIGR